MIADVQLPSAEENLIGKDACAAIFSRSSADRLPGELSAIWRLSGNGLVLTLLGSRMRVLPGCCWIGRPDRLRWQYSSRARWSRGFTNPMVGFKHSIWHEAAVANSKVSPFVLYNLRHTFLTRLGKSGRDAWTLMRIPDHSSITISSRYVHSQDETV